METIGKYQIQKVLGRGGMATVYEALDPTLHRKVAVKVMLQGLAENPDFHAHFLREARAAGGLRHRNIVTVYALGEDKGQPYIALEFLEGTDLEKIIRSREPRPLEWKIGVVRQICEGLAFAHRAGIVHRDVKPANIRVTTDDEIKIMDFGIAHLESSTMTRTGNVLGTVQYMSPEQVAGGNVDLRGDVFSVGVIAYELVAGRRPFDGDDPTTVAYKIVNEAADPGPISGTPYSPRLEQIILKALARDPAARYQALEPMLADLAQLSGAAERAPAIAADEFFVEEAPTSVPQPTVAVVDEFLVDEPAMPLTLPSPPAPAAVAPAPDAEVFFFEDPLPAAPAVPPPPATPPAPLPPMDDGFFVMEESEAAAPPAAPPKPVPAAAPAPPPPAPVPPPPKPVAPAAPAVAPPTAIALPAAKPAAPPAVPPPAKPAAPPRPVSPPAPAAAAATPAPTAPRPASPAPPPTPRARPATPPSPRPATAPRRAVAPQPRAAGRAPSKLSFALGIAAGVVLVVGVGVFAALRFLAKPELQSVEPMRARIGEAVTLVGRNFSATAANDTVMFGQTRAVVRSASSTTLVAEVPELPATSGRDAFFAVSVRVRGRDSQAISVAVYQTGRIHGLSPDVAMPGDEVALAGSGWGPNAIVRFGETAAEIVEATPTQIRVRVPAIDGPPGTSAPVTIADGRDVSNTAPFLVGKLPLITGVQPPSAAAGDVVTLSGRGFHWKAAENVLRVDGVRAFVASASGAEIKFVVPWIAKSGAVALTLDVSESENKGAATLDVAASADPVDFRFAVEPVEATPACNCAAVSTPLGPAFVLAASGNRSAADRALEAARRLNEAAMLLKASRDATLEVRNVETRPILAVTGRPDTVLEVTPEDAAAYNADWTKLGGKGGAVTAARLATWWQAVARDLILVLVRGEKPQHAAAIAPEGRVLGDVFEAARKTGRFGVGRDVVAAMKPPTLAALRVVGLRVPAQVTAPAGSAPAPATATGGSAAAAVPTPSTAPPLSLEGVWVGYSLEGGTRRYITATFQSRGGDLSFEGGVAISLPLFGVEQPQKDSVRFGVEYRGGTRYYSGRWDGKKITGRISTDKSGRGETGAFELSRR